MNGSYYGNGVECRRSTTRADQRVFYPVFTSRDDDGRLAALNPVPVPTSKTKTGTVMPDSEVKNRDRSRARA